MNTKWKQEIELKLEVVGGSWSEMAENMAIAAEDEESFYVGSRVQPVLLTPMQVPTFSSWIPSDFLN